MATPEEMQAAMITNLPEKTGRSLDEWIEAVDESGLEKHSDIVRFLKDEHEMTHGYANLVAHAARDDADGAVDDLVLAQYEGKEALRPIYEALGTAVLAFGDDVELSPKKTYVSLRRGRQFGLIQPSTKSRIDVGLRTTSLVPEGRLESAGSWNQMVTHRVRVSSLEAVDEELVGWLKTAYEEA